MYDGQNSEIRFGGQEKEQGRCYVAQRLSQAGQAADTEGQVFVNEEYEDIRWDNDGTWHVETANPEATKVRLKHARALFPNVILPKELWKNGDYAPEFVRWMTTAV